MDFVGESFEVICGAKAVVQLRRVGDPVAMVRIAICAAGPFIVLRHGADPNWYTTDQMGEQRGFSSLPLTGSEPCILDVVEVFTNGAPRATAPRLVRWVALGRVCSLGQSITVRDDSAETIWQILSGEKAVDILVYRAAFPLLRCRGED